jgi:hypothetical protein
VTDDAKEQTRVIGPNSEWYVKSFERIARRGILESSWLWPAFYASSGWFFYRRMYRWAAGNLIAAALFLITCVRDSPAYVGDLVAPYVFAAYVLALYLAVPISASWLYYRNISARRIVAPPSMWTALGAVVIGIAAAAMAWGPFSWAIRDYYADYNARNVVPAGIPIAQRLAREVSAFYKAHGRLPDSEEAKKLSSAERLLPSGITLSNIGVRDVVYDAPTKRIVITYSYFLIDGKRIAVHATEKAGALDWSCRAIDVPRKLLPTACKD